MIVVAVSGSRRWSNGPAVERVLNERDPDVVMHGACGLELGEALELSKLRGADRWAHAWAKRYKRIVWPYPADWGRYKLQAGPIRNTGMVLALVGLRKVADNVVWCECFPDEQSKGTWDFHRQATAHGLKTFIRDGDGLVCRVGELPWKKR